MLLVLDALKSPWSRAGRRLCREELLLGKPEGGNLDAQYLCCVTAHVPVTLGVCEAETRKSLSLTGCQPTFRFSETSALFQRNMERDRAGRLMASVLTSHMHTPPSPPPHTPQWQWQQQV